MFLTVYPYIFKTEIYFLMKISRYSMPGIFKNVTG